MRLRGWDQDLERKEKGQEGDPKSCACSRARRSGTEDPAGSEAIQDSWTEGASAVPG